ncbi:uncharacterized protein LOC136049143 [Cyrtonyx montezumae]|uniref:uncharacterized protein LOC136049143 n=1 Tax=Cyrtonyx montezumae TaxID=9017 RepID=UPI0032D9DA74
MSHSAPLLYGPQEAAKRQKAESREQNMAAVASPQHLPNSITPTAPPQHHPNSTTPTSLQQLHSNSATTAPLHHHYSITPTSPLQRHPNITTTASPQHHHYSVTPTASPQHRPPSVTPHHLNVIAASLPGVTPISPPLSLPYVTPPASPQHHCCCYPTLSSCPPISPLSFCHSIPPWPPSLLYPPRTPMSLWSHLLVLAPNCSALPHEQFYAIFGVTSISICGDSPELCPLSPMLPRAPHVPPMSPCPLCALVLHHDLTVAMVHSTGGQCGTAVSPPLSLLSLTLSPPPPYS